MPPTTTHMTIKQTIANYLETEERFRERKNKDRGIVNLLMRRFPHLDKAIKDGVLSKDQVIDLVQDYTSMDRAWRQTLEQQPELRGTDYDDKERLEQEKQIDLGYGN